MHELIFQGVPQVDGPGLAHAILGRIPRGDSRE